MSKLSHSHHLLMTNTQLKLRKQKTLRALQRELLKGPLSNNRLPGITLFAINDGLRSFVWNNIKLVNRSLGMAKLYLIRIPFSRKAFEQTSLITQNTASDQGLHDLSYNRTVLIDLQVVKETCSSFRTRMVKSHDHIRLQIGVVST